MLDGKGMNLSLGNIAAMYLERHFTTGVHHITPGRNVLHHNDFPIYFLNVSKFSSIYSVQVVNVDAI